MQKINVISLYNDSALDDLNKDENGEFSYPRFNRISKRAELRLLDWLTGDVEGVKPPEPYRTQKNKDYISHLIKKYPAQAVNGIITKPDDFYWYENMFRIGSKVNADCEEEVDQLKKNCNTIITLLDGDRFTSRCSTYIKRLKPSLEKPIAKEVGDTFEFNPSDIGSTILEYVRYPVYAEIKTMTDPVYNDIVPDPATSINYEWPESVRNILIWFIVDTFSNHTREQAIKQANAFTGKTPRG